MPSATVAPKISCLLVFLGGSRRRVLKCYVFQYLVARRLSGVMFSNTSGAVPAESLPSSRRRVLKCYVFQYLVARRLSGVMFSHTSGAVPAESLRSSQRRVLKCYVFQYLVARRLSGVIEGWCNVPMSAALSWMRRARLAMQVVGGSAACRRARSEGLPPLISRVCVSMAPLVWHKLFHSLNDANVFWQRKCFGVSAGYSRMRSTRLAGMHGCLGSA